MKMKINLVVLTSVIFSLQSKSQENVTMSIFENNFSNCKNRIDVGVTICKNSGKTLLFSSKIGYECYKIVKSKRMKVRSFDFLFANDETTCSTNNEEKEEYENKYKCYIENWAENHRFVEKMVDSVTSKSLQGFNKPDLVKILDGTIYFISADTCSFPLYQISISKEMIKSVYGLGDYEIKAIYYPQKRPFSKWKIIFPNKIENFVEPLTPIHSNWIKIKIR
jgi:hypothetical protein